MALLRFESKLRKGETIALKENRLMFGRHISCGIVLNHPTVSREHFFVERTGEKFFVVDNDSGNGTFVNGERVSWVELQDGDIIKSGPFRLRFELSAQERDTLTLPEEETESFSETHEREYPREYLEGISHFNAGNYFEAHESWEEIWMRSSGEARVFLQMLIQAAVCLHHFEHENARGAQGLYDRVIDKLAHLPAVYMSFDLLGFSQQFRSFFAAAQEEGKVSGKTATAVRPVIHLLHNEAEEADLSAAASEM